MWALFVCVRSRQAGMDVARVWSMEYSAREFGCHRDASALGVGVLGAPGKTWNGSVFGVASSSECFGRGVNNASCPPYAPLLPCAALG